MNILCHDTCHQYFHVLEQLVQNGHNVYHTGRLENEFFRSRLIDLGVKELREVNPKMVTLTRHVNDLDIELIINGNPLYWELGMLGADLLYIGPTEWFSSLETDKWNTRQFVESVGLTPPPLHESGALVVKPSCKQGRTVILQDEDELSKLPFKDFYIEQYVHKLMEVNCNFIVSNGQYHITSIMRTDGEELNKTLTYRPWLIGTTLSPVPEPYRQEIKQLGLTCIEEMAKEDPNAIVQGQLQFLIQNDSQIFLSDINVRPGLYNGQHPPRDWLTAIQHDIKQFTDHEQYLTVNVTHPYHIADWAIYDIIPAGLKYGKKDGRYYIEDGAVLPYDPVVERYVQQHKWLVALRGLQQ